MFSKISFQTFLNSSCVLSVSKNDSKNILSNGKNPSHLIVKVINYDKTFILPAIFDNFEEIIKIPEIKLPIWIHTYLKNKRKDLSNLCGEILPTFDIITISSPLTIEIKFIEVFYMNEQIHDRGIFFSFFKLPELVK